MDTHKIAGWTVYIDICGEHAHIVLADGRRGPALFSHDEALELLELLEGSGLLSDDEIPDLERQIYDSALPNEAPPDIDVLEDLLESRCRATGTFYDKDLLNFGVEDLFEHPEQSEGRVFH